MRDVQFRKKMKKIFIALCVLACICVETVAQDRHSWEQYLEEIYTDEDMDSEWWEDCYDMLCEMENNPLNINTATREQLTRFPFLTAQQVMDIHEYIYKYGAMKSPGELLMIGSIDVNTKNLLSCFIYFGDEEKEKPTLKDILKKTKNEIALFGRIPTYDRKGDKNGYLGYKYKHWIKYSLSSSDRIKAGIVCSQDGGEPFFSGKNGTGYDYKSAYLLIKDFGCLKTLAAGRYKLSFGLGLVANNGFSLGKIAMTQSLGRTGKGIRAHTSRTDMKYFQGTAATFALGKKLSLSAFVSYRKVDATLNDDGTAATLLYNGYHRTATEMEKKNNTTATVAGGDISLEIGDFRVGATTIYTHLDRQLKPASRLYNRYYAKGSDFVNASVNYAFAGYPISFAGETAVDGNGALATINTASLYLGTQLSLTLLQRFYSYRYTSLYSNSFGAGSRSQNESGIYLGVSWKPTYTLKISAFTDYAHFAWARYQVSLPSDAFDNALMVESDNDTWRIRARYRFQIAQKDMTTDDDSKRLRNIYRHKARASAEWKSDKLQLLTQIDAALCDDRNAEPSTSRGIMFTESIYWTAIDRGSHTLNLSLTAKYFNTDDYDSRLYSYERGLPYSSTLASSHYGEGIRYSLLAKYVFRKSLTLAAKVGVSNYFDRSTIGTGLQSIDGSSACDIEMFAKIVL